MDQDLINCQEKNEERSEAKLLEIIDIGTCNLHVLHGAFKLIIISNFLEL